MQKNYCKITLICFQALSPDPVALIRDTVNPGEKTLLTELNPVFICSYAHVI